jgi:hypothetical protein
MKRFTITLCIVLCVVFFTANTLAANIPGGFVAPLKSKDPERNGKLFFYDIQSEKSTDLGIQLPNGGLVAVSRDGKTILWTSGAKLFVRRLPITNERVVKEDKLVDPKGGLIAPIAVDFAVPNGFEALMLSPEGTRFAYKFYRTGDWLIPSPDGAYRLDRDDWIAGDVREILPNLHISREQLLGNTACIAPRYPYRTVRPNGIFQVNHPFIDGVDGCMPLASGSHEMFTSPEVAAGVRKGQSVGPYGRRNPSNFSEETKRLSMKRNVLYTALEDELFAFVLQTPVGLTLEVRPKYAKGKPGMFELPMQQLKDGCAGLSWRPNGNLCVLIPSTGTSINYTVAYSGSLNQPANSEVNIGGKKYTLWEFDGQELRSAIARTPLTDFVPALNLQPRPTTEIQGTKISWVSILTLLFVGNDTGLYLWDNGRIERIFKTAPEQFNYCSDQPPIRHSNSVAESEEKKAPEAQPKWDIQSADKKPEETPLQTGTTSLEWTPIEGNPGVVRFWMNPDDTECSVIQGRLEAVKDLSLLKFEKAETKDVPFGNTLVLLHSGRYRAVEPCKIDEGLVYRRARLLLPGQQPESDVPLIAQQAVKGDLEGYRKMGGVDEAPDNWFSQLTRTPTTFEVGGFQGLEWRPHGPSQFTPGMKSQGRMPKFYLHNFDFALADPQGLELKDIDPSKLRYHKSGKEGVEVPPGQVLFLRQGKGRCDYAALKPGETRQELDPKKEVNGGRQLGWISFEWRYWTKDSSVVKKRTSVARRP